MINYPELSKDKRVKYIYEIILEVLFYYCCYLKEEGQNLLINEYSSIFFEKEEEKRQCIEEYSSFIKVKDKKGNDYDFTQRLINDDYYIIIGNNKFKINLFDYNIIELFQALYDNNLKNLTEKTIFEWLIIYSIILIFGQSKDILK